MAEALFNILTLLLLIARSQKHQKQMLCFNKYPSENATGYGIGPL